MNLPNRLTLIRVCMIPIFVFFMLTDYVPYSKWFAVIIFIIASLTDLLDGKIARRYNLVTNFGKFMDPLADKLLVCSALICFVDLKLISAWIIIVIISREFIISGFRLIASDNGVVIAAGYWGKLKTVSQMIMSILLIIHIEHPVYQIVEQIFIYLSLLLTVISLVDYLYKNKQVLSTKNQK
ncbi:CDP-diacylglycerol--glycerol-3-phosphate 3-phosphatidyltransferase [Velocimicrobium porci]|uniref:CDP-diacylglycerol--glycerol-3-phosphate 3-phosphatidyltransferase n=1 Tax=Velocimicrobium porci TaxID=2606634 RepID=A0A6L5XX83_9FIRM|nr:CDP-diacylglycerol--glycerol-3-phosphate 3-phosphatidyltransferase [Velocimicrobium porci]MSS63352.1 CDP-diacylglycerol--glycerol-3-phosphate 3-phosphatidyltransferase [Velocimicrobium porci]